MLEDFQAACGRESICLRNFNAVGADSACDIGESPDPETHLLPLIPDAATGKRHSILVFGLDNDTPDGSCLRHFAHVSCQYGTCEADLSNLLDGAPSTDPNLGYGREYSFLELIAAVEKSANRSVATTEALRRPGDSVLLFSDPGAALNILGWWLRHLKHFASELDQNVLLAAGDG